MASTIKVDNVQNQPGTNIIDKCGTTITLGQSGDTVSLASGASQTGFGRTGTVDWITTVKVTGDSPITAVSGKGYFLNTTAGTITLNLPTSPSAGDIVSVKDYARTFATNEVTLGRGGSNMDGVAADTPLATNGLSITTIYVDATRGWTLINDDAASGMGAQYIVATGGNATLTCGNYKTHVFTGPGALCVSCAGNCAGSNKVEYVVVAGGGSSGGDGIKPGQGHQGGGGGGAGGFRSYTSLPAPTVSPLNGPGTIPVSASPYPITVGAGGAGLTANTSVGNIGSSSIFSTITSAGGAGGGSTAAPCNGDGGAGASGGGGAAREAPQPLSSGGVGNTPPTSPPQGQPGGSGGRHCYNVGAGAGGGAGAAGADQSPVCTQYGMSGGDGSYIADDFFGPTAPSYGQSPTPLAPNGRYFSGGGGGGSGNVAVPVPATPYGGAGGGGEGGDGNTTATSGGTNTGGGGGGSAMCITNPPSPGTTPLGGSGIVMIRYRYQ